MKSARLLLWFFVGFLISAVPMLAFAATTYNVPVAGVSSTPSGLVHTSRLGISSPLYPALSTTSPLGIPIATMVPPGKQLMVIPTSIAANVPRVAGAVVGLARLSGPIGLGLTLLPILCQETSICQSGTSNDFSKLSVPSSSYFETVGRDSSGQNVLIKGTTPEEACLSAVATYNANTTVIHTYVRSTNTECVYSTVSAGSMLQTIYARFCPSGQALIGQSCATATPTNLPPTDEDWASAVTKLTAAVNRMGDIVSGLQALGQPVPVNKPVLSPVSQTSPPLSTVKRDPQGNVINTTTTTTTTNISPVTNTNTTNQVTVNQITNTTVTNANGEVESTSDTTSDPAPEDETAIEFDDVPDSELEKQEIPLTLEPESWGEGSCPSDPTVNVMGAVVTIPVSTVCDYMTMIRPVVLAFFALVSAYIVIGVKQDA